MLGEGKGMVIDGNTARYPLQNQMIDQNITNTGLPW